MSFIFRPNRNDHTVSQWTFLLPFFEHTLCVGKNFPLYDSTLCYCLWTGMKTWFLNQIYWLEMKEEKEKNGTVWNKFRKRGWCDTQDSVRNRSFSPQNSQFSVLCQLLLLFKNLLNLFKFGFSFTYI